MEPPARVMSPTLNTQGGRGASLGPRLVQPPGQPPPQKKKKPRVASLESVQELERTTSRDSINFSYPTGSRPNSPTPPASPISPISGTLNTKGPVSTPVPPKPSPAISAAETASVQYSVTEAANKPVKKKKKVVARGVGEGSHLSSGGAGGKPAGTAVDASPAQIAALAAPALQRKEEVTPPPPQPVEEEPKKPKKKKSKPKVTEPQQEDYQPQHVRYGSESDSVSEREAQNWVRPQNQSTRSSGQLAKQPSIVREDWEGEEQAELNHEPSRAAVPPSTSEPSTAAEPAPRPKKKRPAAANTSKKFVESSTQPQPQLEPQIADQPPPTLITTVPSPELLPPVVTKSLTAQVNGNGKVPRPPSLSPSRQAHFSSNVLLENLNEPKHQPPPRSVSPAKSAMKHHSPSPQALSPIEVMPGSWNRGISPGEGSDGTTSVISDDGAKAILMKKKSVRVSFDDDTVVVGGASAQAIKPSEPSVPEEASPKEPAKRSWFGRGKAPQPSPSDEFDDGIKPMPALPSFGSIRQKRMSSDNSTPLSSEDTSSTASSVSGRNTQDTSLSVSSDHALAGILSHDFASKAKKQPAAQGPSNEPLPPEVTSVEGFGYGSDTDETDGSICSVEKVSGVVDKATVPDGTPLAPTSIKDSEGPATSHHELATLSPESNPDHQIVPEQTHEAEIPSIAVHPATPASEHGERGEGFLVMPGGFPVSTDTLDKAPSLDEPPTILEPNTVTPATTGIAEPTPPEAAAYQDPSSPSVGRVAQGLGIQTAGEEVETDNSGDSIYSDAAEDASDFEGDGFGSINAIVESPVVSPVVQSPQSPSFPSSSSPDSPASRSLPVKGGSKGISDPVSQEGWDKAQTRWSNINQSLKEGKQATAVQPSLGAPIELSAPQPKPKKKKKQKKTVPMNADQQLTSLQAARTAPSSSQAPKSAMKQPGPPAMRRSMRSEPEPAVEEEPTHMRQSMRSGGAMRGSMRGAPPPRNQRHSVDSAPPPEPRGTLQKRNLRPVSEMAPYSGAGVFQQPNKPAAPKAPPATTAQPKSGPAPSKKAPLQRTFSNDSDSSSSFKKSRPKKATGERYNMRRSMRSVSVGPQATSPVPEGQPKPKRVSNTPARPMSASGGMRSTMRGSVDSTAPSPRNRERPTSPSSFFTGRKAKPKAKPAKSPTRFNSRFGESSDEEDGPKIFRSRYADSSEEDLPLPKNLRPVRGIPKKQNEGDSTDLEDSSDGEAPPAPSNEKPLTSPQASAPANQVGNALATGSLRRTSSGRDLSKSGDVDAEQKKKGGFFGRFRSKKDKSKVQKPDTLPAVRSGLGRTMSPSPAVDGDGRPPKLQRRVTPKRFGSASWPLPDPDADANSNRPSTSDGAVPGTDVRFGNTPGGVGGGMGNGRTRAGTDSTTNTEKGNNAIIGRTGKKKRFPMLRKAFGLDD